VDGARPLAARATGGLERPRISGHKGGMSSAASIAVTPNRDFDTENFPTASLLLARTARAQVMAFYRFVRTADDIADSAELPPEEKLARLDAMERSLEDPSIPLNRLGVGTAEARLMLSAFRQDATCARYADWAALEDYCRRSADPSAACCSVSTATATTRRPMPPPTASAPRSRS
jgi:hypothetical protein